MWGSDPICGALLNYISSIIRTKFDYGRIVYCTAKKTVLKKLNSVHNIGIRIAIGASRISPVSSILNKVGEPNLEERRELLT